MKRVLINGIFAGLAMLSLPAVFAQDKDVKEKTKSKDDVQQIIITRKGNVEGKTIIEINGDKVLVDGKEVKDKNGNVTVRTHKIKDASAYRGGYGPGNFNFNFDELQVLDDIDHNNAMTLFKEDENRAMLGVVTDSDEKGARINSVTKESAAEKAGLKEDDIITKINDTKIEDAADVTEEIRKHKPGEKLSITFLRGGKEQKTTAELGKWKGIKMGPENFRMMAPPEKWEGMRAPGATFFGMGGAPKLGLSVQDTEDGKGVKVVDVDEESNAAKAGLKEEDIITHINNLEVNSADAIAKEVRASKEKTAVQLKVLRNGKAQNIEVKIPRKLKTADL